MIRRPAAALMCLVIVLLCFATTYAPAEQAETVVRVGWYDTPFNYKDSFGRRTGYAYEYQRKIAAYTGWKYEYVEGTWPELMDMLREGRIDLMSDVSWTEDRKDQMLFSSTPMGSEMYYLYIARDNEEIRIEDPGTLNGKKVGITRGTVQTGLFSEWLATRGITVDLVELDSSEQESISMMRHGELDAFITLDTYGDTETITPLWKIGSSDFYFAVSQNRPDLLAGLNAAINRIQEENKFYSEGLSEKYLIDSGTNQYLTAEENAWLEAHGPIRVGYQDGYMAFCAADPKTGELTGALKDYLEAASGVMVNVRPEFKAVAFPTAADAMEALRNGEIDCMFPANLTEYDGEQAAW